LNTSIRQISEGDLTVQVPICSEKDQIGNGLTDLVNNFHGLVASIATAIDQVTSGANLVSDSSLSLSQGATNQASTVQELTASLEQVSEQTHLNAQNAETANALAKSAKSNAAEGNTQMKDMLKAMEDISISSANINKIIKVIDDIAFQTNILALNAAVEAARAGQHGKGFAVVAEEVRNLAGKSANAAKETTEMIENSIRKVEAGTKIANQTAKSLDEIVFEVDRAADLINSIAVASIEQARSIEQINFGITQVSQVVQTNAATAEESAAASEELSGQAAQLKEHVSSFRLKVGINETGPKTTVKLTARGKTDPSTKISLSSGNFGKY
jgi:methyl-accepting chemotaxis protein